MNAILVEEIWRKIPGWPEYEASNIGRLKRVKGGFGTKNGFILSPWTTKNGYKMVGLSRKSKVKYMLVHRLIAMAFIEDPSGKDVCHNNGVRSDNRVENLRLDTRKGNMSDVYKHDTHIRGERCGTNKYSQELIAKFKEDIKTGKSIRSIAIKHGIKPSTGYSIADGRTWGWL